jgi:hypothetical protein
MVVGRIPFKRCLEYAADVLSASRVYNPKDYDFMVAYDYFKEHSKTYLMHPASKEFILWVIKNAYELGFKNTKKNVTKVKFKEICEKYPNTIIVPLSNVGYENFAIKD